MIWWLTLSCCWLFLGVNYWAVICRWLCHRREASLGYQGTDDYLMDDCGLNYRRAGWRSQHGQECWPVVYCSKTWTSDIDNWYALMSVPGMDEENTSWWLCKGMLYVEDCDRDDWPVDCVRGYWPADDCARENGAVDDCAHGMTELWLIFQRQKTCGWLWYCVRNEAWDDWPVDDRNCTRLCQEWLTSGWFDDFPVNGCAMRMRWLTCRWLCPGWHGLKWLTSRVCLRITVLRLKGL